MIIYIYPLLEQFHLELFHPFCTQALSFIPSGYQEKQNIGLNISLLNCFFELFLHYFIKPVSIFIFESKFTIAIFSDIFNT